MHFSMTSHHEIFDSAASSGMLGHLGGGTPQSAQPWQAFRTVLPLFSALNQCWTPLKSRCCNGLQKCTHNWFLIGCILPSVSSRTMAHYPIRRRIYNLGIFLQQPENYCQAEYCNIYSTLRFILWRFFKGLVSPLHIKILILTGFVLPDTTRLHCDTSSEQVTTWLTSKLLLIHTN